MKTWYQTNYEVVSSVYLDDDENLKYDNCFQLEGSVGYGCGDRPRYNTMLKKLKLEIEFLEIYEVLVIIMTEILKTWI